MFDFSFDDHEIEGLRLKLKELPLYLTDDVHTEALKKAAKPLLEAMLLRVPVNYLTKDDAVHLKDSLKIRKSKFKEIGQHQVIVGAEKKKGGHGYIAHMLEYGTSGRTKKNGAKTGQTRARPFMRPAEAATQSIVEELYIIEIQKAVDRRLEQ